MVSCKKLENPRRLGFCRSLHRTKHLQGLRRGQHIMHPDNARPIVHRQQRRSGAGHHPIRRRSASHRAQ